MIFQEESGDKDTEPSCLCDAELDDETIGRALPSPLFIQERDEPADRRQAYHSYEESLLPTQSFSVSLKNGETRARTSFAEFVQQRKTKSRNGKRNHQDSSCKRQKEQMLAVFGTEIQKHEFQAHSDRRSIQELNGIIESQRR